MYNSNKITLIIKKRKERERERNTHIRFISRKTYVSFVKDIAMSEIPLLMSMHDIKQIAL